MNKCYLAGGISGLSYDEAVQWRDYACAKFHHNVVGISPMRGKAYLATEQSINDSYSDTLLSTSKAITARDYFDTRTAQVLLINLLKTTRVTIGTMIEIGWAHAHKVPIVLVMESGNIHDHGMVRECASFIATTLDDGIHIVNAIFAL